MLRKRLITEQLRKLSKVFPIITLSGARQVGKTTLLHEIFGSDFDYVVFDPTIDVQNARSDPDLFLSSHKPPLILDEIQYAPELVASLKRKIDEDKTPGQYYLTGSQQWGVIQSMSESLAGRTVFLELGGFTLSEIAGISSHRPWLDLWLHNPTQLISQKFALANTHNTVEQIWRGFLPDAQSIPLDTITQYYQAYHRTYIERDIRILADISDWQLFGRFVQLTAAMSAQEINFSKLGRELGITPQTSKRWLELLRATYQWFEIPPFSPNSIKKISNKPKGYLADTGSICTLHAITNPSVLTGHPLWGSIFETAVVSDILKQAAALPYRPNFFHWRSHSGSEVDLVIELNGQFFPIEIKGATHPSKNATRGIAAFRNAYPKLNISHGLVICTSETVYPLNDNDFAMPWNFCVQNDAI